MRHVIPISGMTLTLESPSLLRPSKDFPPPYVANRVELEQVKSPISLLAGYWDGPKYQLLSVTGTLEISLSVKPWPEAALGKSGCQARVRSIADTRLALQMDDYRRGLKALPPELTFESIKLAGRSAFHYRFSSSDALDYYVIPLTDGHYISLIFGSADNSPMKGGWPGLSAKAQAAFLQSLMLSGDDPICGG